MPSELPETIDPLRLAKTGRALSGSYELRQFDRVNASLKDGSKVQVSYKLEFSRDDKNQLFCIVGDLGSPKIDLLPKALGPNSILP